jgi:hypothetical protein
MIETTTPTPVSSMRLLCHVRMFKPQFAPLVESGVKCQTVRPKPKRMPKAGDRISLRMWTGKPYRSKQRVLRESEIVQVQSIWFNGVTILLDDPKGEKGLLPRAVEEAFARADGFENLKAMSDWFEANHGLPFEGIVIKWHNDQAHRRRAQDA